MKKSSFLSIFALAGMMATVSGVPLEFDFKDPKGVNNAVFKLDAPLESINGTATGISGKVSFDPENPATVKGRILIDAASMHVGNPTMKEHLQGDKWMNVARHPQIEFEVTKAKNVKTSGHETTAEIEGTMNIKGVAKAMTVPVKLSYLKDKLKARGGTNQDGDLLVIRANFAIKRSDFAINPGSFEDKVSDEIELSLAIAGAAPRPVRP